MVVWTRWRDIIIEYVVGRGPQLQRSLPVRPPRADIPRRLVLQGVDTEVLRSFIHRSSSSFSSNNNYLLRISTQQDLDANARRGHIDECIRTTWDLLRTGPFPWTHDR